MIITLIIKHITNFYVAIFNPSICSIQKRILYIPKLCVSLLQFLKLHKSLIFFSFCFLFILICLFLLFLRFSKSGTSKLFLFFNSLSKTSSKKFLNGYHLSCDNFDKSFILKLIRLIYSCILTYLSSLYNNIIVCALCILNLIIFFCLSSINLFSLI